MPRATRSTTRTPSQNAKISPYLKSSPKDLNKHKHKSIQNTSPDADRAQSGAKPVSKPRTGKDSHLYTDDNPSTTLQGTGFKDAATAHSTLQLIRNRSLLYQFQTVNTMYHRAKHHPHSSGNKNMQDAMAIFREWLDVTYPTAKREQIDFSPVLRRDVVEAYLPGMRKEHVDTTWAEKYVALPKGKRLANVLMDDEKPGEADLARFRQDKLEELFREADYEVPPGRDDDILWSKFEGRDDVVVSLWHLKCIAHAWSPVKTDLLLKRIMSS